MTSKYLEPKPVEQLNFEVQVMEILCFKINHETPMKKVWDMIRKISGKKQIPQLYTFKFRRH